MTSEFSRVAALPPRRETRIECKIAHHMSRLFTHVLFVQKSIYVSPTTSSRRGDACTIASILRESQFKRFPFFPFFFSPLLFDDSSNWQLFETPTCLE